MIENYGISKHIYIHSDDLLHLYMILMTFHIYRQVDDFYHIYTWINDFFDICTWIDDFFHIYVWVDDFENFKQTDEFPHLFFRFFHSKFSF